MIFLYLLCELGNLMLCLSLISHVFMAFQSPWCYIFLIALLVPLNMLLRRLAIEFIRLFGYHPKEETFFMRALEFPIFEKMRPEFVAIYGLRHRGYQALYLVLDILLAIVFWLAFIIPGSFSIAWHLHPFLSFLMIAPMFMFTVFRGEMIRQAFAPYFGLEIIVTEANRPIFVKKPFDTSLVDYYLKTDLSRFLEGIPGIGPKRKSILLKRYKHLSDLQFADLEDLVTLGIPKKVSETVLKRAKEISEK